MEQTSYAREIAERLAPSNGPAGFADFFVAVLRELAKGRPVSQEVLAASLLWSPHRLADLLEQACSAEYDDAQNIVGYGLTLRETAHAFEIDGRRLYTWCALDTLMFPALLGKTASVSSRCRVTGVPIALHVSAYELRSCQPERILMSLPQAGAWSDIRQSFCCHVNFFASSQEGRDWVSAHPGTEMLEIGDAFRLGQEVTAQVTRQARQYRESVA